MSTRLASPELANCALWVRPLWASHLPKLSDNPRYYDALCIFAVCGVNKGPSMPARPSYPKAWNWGEKVPLYLIRVIQQIFQDLSDCACVHNLCWYLQVCILLYLLGKFTYMGNHGDINCWQTNTHWWHAVISLCFCFLPTRVASKKPWGSTILQLALNCRSQELFGLNLCHLPRQVSPWSFRFFQTISIEPIPEKRTRPD